MRQIKYTAESVVEKLNRFRISSNSNTSVKEWKRFCKTIVPYKDFFTNLVKTQAISIVNNCIYFPDGNIFIGKVNTALTMSRKTQAQYYSNWYSKNKEKKLYTLEEAIAKLKSDGYTISKMIVL